MTSSGQPASSGPLATSSPDPLLLDTHVWLNYLGASPELTPPLVATIEAARSNGSVFVSAISVWEVALLAKLHRIALRTSVTAWVEHALALPGIQLVPLTPEIAILSVNLPEPLHEDPSDRIILASARAENLTLVTRDRAMLAFARATQLACLQA